MNTYPESVLLGAFWFVVQEAHTNDVEAGFGTVQADYY